MLCEAVAVREFLEEGPKGWKRRLAKDRWQVEAVFSSSSLKRMMGGYVSSVMKEGIAN